VIVISPLYKKTIAFLSHSHYEISRLDYATRKYIAVSYHYTYIITYIITINPIGLGKKSILQNWFRSPETVSKKPLAFRISESPVGESSRDNLKRVCKKIYPLIAKNPIARQTTIYHVKISRDETKTVIYGDKNKR